MTPSPPHALTTEELNGRADALLSGLKVGRMPDGKHFASDIGALISFAKWYASRLTTDTQARDAVPVHGVMLRSDLTHAIVEVETPKGTWVELMRERLDSPFSHICEPSGIRARALKLKPTQEER